VQVLGIDEPLFRLVLPFVTVYSPRSGINPEVAPPALLAALMERSNIANVMALVDQPYPNVLDRKKLRLPGGTVAGSPASGTFLLHAEVIIPSGALAVREAIIAFQPGVSAARQIIREWRRGIPRYGKVLKDLRQNHAGLPSC